VVIDGLRSKSRDNSLNVQGCGLNGKAPAGSTGAWGPAPRDGMPALIYTLCSFAFNLFMMPTICSF
jgi:hypothetical protein